VARIEGGSLILEFLRDSSLHAGAALAAFAGALRGAERVSTLPARIQRRTKEEDAKRARAEADIAAANADRAEAENRQAEALRRRYHNEVAAHVAEDTLTALTVAVSRLHDLTGGTPEVEELPAQDPENNE